MDYVLDICLDAGIDSIKLFPFLFVTYLAMEYLEHKTTAKTKNMISKAGKFGPILGGILGALPQCGFSAAASNLYAGRVISVGTLIAIFLSTSDEMLPIMISEKMGITLILQILLVKMVIGVVVGILVDVTLMLLNRQVAQGDIHHLCEHEHCHCEKSIVKSALKHSLQIFTFIFVISLILNAIVMSVGTDALSNFVAKGNIVSIFFAALVGLIPNCAASVVITQLYLEHIISTGAMLAGLLVGSGVGVLVVFRMNHHLKENMMIVTFLYVTGVLFGLVFEGFGIHFL